MDEQETKGIIRWLIKAASIVFVAAVLCGGFYGYSLYLKQWMWTSRLERDRALEQLKEDSLAKANQRFVLGAGAGALLGLAYVVRRAVRREEL